MGIGSCSDGSCEGGSCGRPGQPCCEVDGPDFCSGPYAICIGGVCDTCGNEGELCCSPGAHCNGRLICDTGFGPDYCVRP